jgi:cytochrome c55X
MEKRALFRTAGRALAATLALACAQGQAQEARPPAEPRRGEIVNMVRQDCGSCHGLTMRGGLGPPLLPAALAEKDPGQLRFVVLQGRRGTAMPPWSRFLSEDEAAWVVDLLRKGLPRD